MSRKYFNKRKKNPKTKQKQDKNIQRLDYLDNTTRYINPEQEQS